MQAKRQIDILEVGTELFGKHPHIEQRLTPIKRAGSAGAEDLAALQISRREGLAVAALAGHAAGEVAIPGAVDMRHFLAWSSVHHERGDGGDVGIDEGIKGGFRPAR